MWASGSQVLIACCLPGCSLAKNGLRSVASRDLDQALWYRLQVSQVASSLLHRMAAQAQPSDGLGATSLWVPPECTADFSPTCLVTGSAPPP